MGPPSYMWSVIVRNVMCGAWLYKVMSHFVGDESDYGNIIVSHLVNVTLTLHADH